MGENAVGMSTPPPATTQTHIIFLKSGIFLMKGGAEGRNLTKGGGP